MRAFIAVLVVTILVVGGACSDRRPGSRAEMEDTPENRRQAVEEYLRIVPPTELMRDATEKVADTLPEPVRANFVTAMAGLDVKPLNDAMRDSMVKRFTVAEINALTRFYGSEEGKSVMKKFGSYMSDVMPVMQAEMAKAMAKARQAS